MGKHTPGPWVFKKRDIYGRDWIEIGEFRNDVVILNNHDSNLANAALIAAAPELLEACQAFVQAWDKSLQLEKTDVALRKARAAIARATGEAENV